MERITSQCMICISTRQNTANLIPFLQFDFGTMIILETEYAQKEKWSDGLEKVLNESGKKTKNYTIGSGLDLSEMLARIRGIVTGYDSVCWNIGGGQKMQQMAMMRVFEERLRHNKKDWACYADPGTKNIYTITGDKHNLDSAQQAINTAITLDDILTVFQLRKRQSNRDVLLWQRAETKGRLVGNTFRDASYFWDTAKRRELLRAVFDGTEKNHDILNGYEHGYADYFEEIAQAEVVKILRRHAPDHHITEAWGNVRVKDKNNKEIAEWDIVLVTDFGTLIILDAKTGIFKSKDEDARLFNLEKATGFYGKFWLIIPYLFEDMKTEEFYAEFGDEGKKTRRIPVELNRLSSNVLAITGHKKNFYLQKRRKNKVQVVEEQKSPDDVQLTDISFLLDKLRVHKKTVQ